MAVKTILSGDTWEVTERVRCVGVGQSGVWLEFHYRGTECTSGCAVLHGGNEKQLAVDDLKRGLQELIAAAQAALEGLG
jgi:hypothetical protein